MMGLLVMMTKKPIIVLLVMKTKGAIKGKTQTGNLRLQQRNHHWNKFKRLATRTAAIEVVQNTSSVKTENVNANMEKILDIVDDVKNIVEKMKNVENEDPNTSVYVDMVKIGEVNASLNLSNVMMNVALAQNVAKKAEG